MDDVTAASCVEFAIKIEAMGAELYESLSRKFSSDREFCDLFAALGRDEVQHRALFQALHDRALTRPSERRIPSELAQYLRAMAMSDVFSGMKGLHGDLEAIGSREDALERALGFEKATLGYFQAMRDVFEGDEVLASLVAVEKGHVVKVMELMLTGARFGGLADHY